MKHLILFLLTLTITMPLQAQKQVVSSLQIVNNDGGSNSDGVYIYRDDAVSDRASLKIRVGDEYTSDFQIGYKFYKDGKWYRNFSVDGYGNGFFNRNLDVNGKIRAEEVQVVVDVPADYVFEQGYDLKPLAEVAAYIKRNGHLPNVPSAQQIKAEGWHVGQMNNKLLEKIEELTLYQIQLLETIEAQSAMIGKLEQQYNLLEKALQQLKSDKATTSGKLED